MKRNPSGGLRILALIPLLGCASSVPDFGSTAPIHANADAPTPTPVARMLTEDPFAQTPPAPRMMHHGRYLAPVPGTEQIGDEAVPNEDPSQGMGMEASDSMEHGEH